MAEERFPSVAEDEIERIFSSQRDASSDDEEEIECAPIIPHSRSTKKVTRFHVKLFKEYLRARGLPENFEKFGKSELDGILSKFYVEVRNKNGEKYRRNSLLGIRHGINRHLQKYSDHDLFIDKEFRKSTTVFDAVLKDLKKFGKWEVNSHIVMCDDDVKKMFEYFDLNDPIKLQHKVFVDVMLYFRGGRAKVKVQTLRQLKTEDFIRSTDDTGTAYIQLVHDHDEGELSTDRMDKRMYALKDDEKCPVRSFMIYKSHLDPECPSFFQRAKETLSTSEQIWYKQSPLGKNTLGIMMPQICKAAGLSLRYTCHSLYATKLHSFYKNVDIHKYPYRERPFAEYSNSQDAVLGMQMRGSQECQSSNTSENPENLGPHSGANKDLAEKRAPKNKTHDNENEDTIETNIKTESLDEVYSDSQNPQNVSADQSSSNDEAVSLRGNQSQKSTAHNSEHDSHQQKTQACGTKSSEFDVIDRNKSPQILICNEPIDTCSSTSNPLKRLIECTDKMNSEIKRARTTTIHDAHTGTHTSDLRLQKSKTGSSELHTYTDTTCTKNRESQKHPTCKESEGDAGINDIKRLKQTKEYGAESDSPKDNQKRSKKEGCDAGIKEKDISSESAAILSDIPTICLLCGKKAVNKSLFTGDPKKNAAVRDLVTKYFGCELDSNMGTSLCARCEQLLGQLDKVNSEMYDLEEQLWVRMKHTANGGLRRYNKLYSKYMYEKSRVRLAHLSRSGIEGYSVYWNKAEPSEVVFDGTSVAELFRAESKEQLIKFVTFCQSAKRQSGNLKPVGVVMNYQNIQQPLSSTQNSMISTPVLQKKGGRNSTSQMEEQFAQKQSFQTSQSQIHSQQLRVLPPMASVSGGFSSGNLQNSDFTNSKFCFMPASTHQSNFNTSHQNQNLVQIQNFQPAPMQLQNVQPTLVQTQYVQPGSGQSQYIHPAQFQAQYVQPVPIQIQNVQSCATQIPNVQPGTLQIQNVQPGTVQMQNNQSGTAQTQSIQQGTLQMQSVQSGAAQIQSVQPGTVQVENVQPSTTQLQSVQQGTVQMQNVQQGTAQIQSVQPGTVQMQSVQPGTVQMQSVQPGTVQMQNVQPGTMQMQSVQPGTMQMQSVQPGTMQIQNVQPQMMQNVQTIPLQIQNFQPGIMQIQNVQQSTMQVPNVQQSTMQVQSVHPVPVHTHSVEPYPVQIKRVQRVEDNCVIEIKTELESPDGLTEEHEIEDESDNIPSSQELCKVKEEILDPDEENSQELELNVRVKVEDEAMFVIPLDKSQNRTYDGL